MRTVLRSVVVMGCLTGVWPGSVHGVEPDPIAARKEYELRVARVADTYQGIRFKPATGET